MNTRNIFTIFFIIAVAQMLLGGGRLQLFLQDPVYFVFLMLSILIALVIHEFFHAFTADRLGDPNPRIAGRVSLNPLKHLDPLGTLLIVVTGFGWGKPVQFDPYNLKDPAKDGAWIAAAGPLSNIGLAIICSLLIRFIAMPELLFLFIFMLFSINLSLAIFNLLPIYPLDGHHIVRAFLPTNWRASYDLFNRRFGMIIAFFLIIPFFNGGSIVTQIMSPALDFAYQILLGI